MPSFLFSTYIFMEFCFFLFLVVFFFFGGGGGGGGVRKIICSVVNATMGKRFESSFLYWI